LPKRVNDPKNLNALLGKHKNYNAMQSHSPSYSGVIDLFLWLKGRSVSKLNLRLKFVFSFCLLQVKCPV